MYQPKQPYQKNDVYICKTATGDLIDKVILEVSTKNKMLKISKIHDWLRVDDVYYEWIPVEEFRQTVTMKIGVVKEFGFWIFKHKSIVYE